MRLLLGEQGQREEPGCMKTWNEELEENQEQASCLGSHCLNASLCESISSPSFLEAGSSCSSGTLTLHHFPVPGLSTD